MSSPHEQSGTIELDTLNIIEDQPREEILHHLAEMNVIILGIPGAGKSTLAQELQAEESGINYVSLGEISRNLPADSPQRQELNQLFAKGAPVGDPGFFLDLIDPYVSAAQAEGKGFILDGIPKKAEEVEPLLDWFASKDMKIDLIVSCELPSLTAYERITTRPERPGDQDTMEVFTNRVATYLRDIDVFKSQLSGGGNVPLVRLDTAEKEPQEVVDELLTTVASIMHSEVSEKDSNDELLKQHLYELMRQGRRPELIALLGEKFDDYIPSIDHGELLGEDTQSRMNIVMTALTEQDPRLVETPLFLKRFAENYLDTTFESLGHLADSLSEEAEARFGSEYTADQVFQIFEQQCALKDLIQNLQAEITGNRDIAELVEQELQINERELAHIQDVLFQRATAIGIDPAHASVASLMNLQALLWGQFTSNQILFAPDLNYRSSANGQPGAHHSLLPFTHNPRAMAANSMGNYVSFIEAVSATEFNGFSSTFGFIHFTGMDKTGEAYGAEFPIMMHDNRLLSLENPTINEILGRMESLYGNHDLWHNLLPVYADHFILHHPHAPISYGGRLPEYVEFGKATRTLKEEYEIGVAMAHARTQRERFEDDPILREEQEGHILTALEKIPNLRTELADQLDEDSIEEIIDYLACRAATKAYSVFPAGDPLHKTIDTMMRSIGVPMLEVSASQVATLLWKQKLIDVEKAHDLLASRGVEVSEILSHLEQDSSFARKLIADCLHLDRTDRETGAEHIGSALQEWGAIEQLAQNGNMTVSGSQKARWLAIMGPQREQLRGHMEKVHGKEGYVFGDRALTEPRDLVLLQRQAIEKDGEHYAYRLAARSENQRLSYELYSLLFNDGQDTNNLARFELENLRTETTNDESVKAVVSAIDSLIHELVSVTYGNLLQELDILNAFVQNRDSHSPLASAVRSSIERYEKLKQMEEQYQRQIGSSYPEATKTLIDEQMQIA